MQKSDALHSWGGIPDIPLDKQRSQSVKDWFRKKS
jgi:hypothetical protein